MAIGAPYSLLDSLLSEMVYPRINESEKPAGYSLPPQVVFASDQPPEIRSGLEVDWNIWNFTLCNHLIVSFVG